MKFANGKEYLKAIGFKPTAGYEDAMAYLTDQIGYMKAKNILDIVNNRGKQAGKLHNGSCRSLQRNRSGYWL